MPSAEFWALADLAEDMSDRFREPTASTKRAAMLSAADCHGRGACTVNGERDL